MHQYTSADCTGVYRCTEMPRSSAKPRPQCTSCRMCCRTGPSVGSGKSAGVSCRSCSQRACQDGVWDLAYGPTSMSLPGVSHLIAMLNRVIH
jgi:hypothetical protein